MHCTCRLYARAAKKYHLPVIELPEIDGFAVLLGGKSYFFRGASAPFNRDVNARISNNKYCMNQLLSKAGFPVPKAIGFTKYHYETEDFSLEGLHYPVVLKPTLNTWGGQGVCCNIPDETTLRGHIERYLYEDDYGILSVEAFQKTGRSFRVLVFQGKIIGLVERRPAEVTGDGVKTIEALAEEKNIKIRKWQETLTISEIPRDDPETLTILTEQSLSWESIPEAGQVVKLFYRCNSGVGGTMHTVEKALCPENEKLCLDAAKLLGLELVGFDILLDDVDIPYTKTGGCIIESNHHPDMSLHENPISGRSVFVTEIMMKALIKRHPVSYLKILIHYRVEQLMRLLVQGRVSESSSA